MRSAIERGEGLTVEFEFDGQDRARLLGMDLASGLGVAADLIDPRIAKDAGVKARRFLGLGIEP